ncbi:hypothetical protein Pfo_014817 [Paulownia fortunei]|nr:hypothetical protein Pfo_014817 [Paulownia fortunei]
MEAQLQRPTHGHHHHEEDPHDTTGLHSVIGGEGEGEHNHHGEKKSVLKKVKDKAMKIKDTIKKHGHGHERDYRHDHISEEEGDEEEEMVHAPEVHGAPMYESAVIPGTNLPIQTGVNVEKPTDTREDLYNPNIRNEVYPYVGDEGVTRRTGKMGTDLARPTVEAREPELKNPRRSSPNAIDMEEANVVEPMVKIGPLVGLEEDPHSPKNHPGEIPPSNYQAKVIDPTGEEAEVAPLVERLHNLHVRDESESNPVSEQRSYTGSHDQFAPQPTPTKDQFNPESNPASLSKIPESPKSYEPAPRETIAGKISSATSVIADKAVSAKNVVASKLGYGVQHQEGQDSSSKPASEPATEYGHKVAGKMAPVYEKVAGAGSAILSKVQRGGGVEDEGGDAVAKGTDKGVSMKEYLAEKFRPGDEDKALSEVITDAFHKKKEVMRGTGEEQPMGRVMESEEVAARLGTGKESKREGEDAWAAGSESSGAGVVDRLKGAVGLWVGKSTGMQTAQHSLGQSYMSDGGSAPSGEVGHSKEEAIRQQPRLQESGN